METLRQFWRHVRSSNCCAFFHEWDTGEEVGGANEDGRFNITYDLSLIIKYSGVHDEGRYICEVIDMNTGFLYSSETNLAVQG